MDGVKYFLLQILMQGNWGNSLLYAEKQRKALFLKACAACRANDTDIAR
jgi:hypothetical protein